MHLTNRVAEAALGVVAARCPVGAGPFTHPEAPVPHADDRIAPVRGLLRHGKYRPSGRGKPASEYLIGAAAKQAFPSVAPVVDLVNWVSWAHRLPISLVDAKKADADDIVVRRGAPDERYVFNSADQVIDLQDLLLVARAGDDLPLANPVKDSMLAKFDDATDRWWAVIYAPTAGASWVQAAVEDIRVRLTDGAALAEVHVGHVVGTGDVRF